MAELAWDAVGGRWLVMGCALVGLVSWAGGWGAEIAVRVYGFWGNGGCMVVVAFASPGDVVVAGVLCWYY